jgi:hypothetical protein
LRPVPPAIADLWIAVEGEAETWIAAWAPSQETSTWSITTGHAQELTTIPPWAVEALPTVRFESSIPLEAGTFEIVIGPEEVSIVIAPVPKPSTCRFEGAVAPIANEA